VRQQRPPGLRYPRLRWSGRGGPARCPGCAVRPGREAAGCLSLCLPARRQIRLVQVYLPLASARPDGQNGRRLRSQPRQTGTW